MEKSPASSKGKAEARGWLPLWVIPVMVVMAIGTVWLRLSIVRTAYEIDQVDRQTRALQQAREQMDIKVTALRSPRRLELIARTKFGLSPPRAEQIIHMSDNLSTNPQHAIEKTMERSTSP